MVTPVAAVCMSTSGDVRHAPALTQLDVPIKYLVAGGVAGGVARTSVAPLSRLKVLVQVNSNSIQYTSVLSGLRQIVRSEGLRGLYIGNGADCIRIVPHSAAKFLCYEHLIARADSWIARHPGSEAWQPALRVASGSAAGIIAGTLTYPLDMIRGRLMVQGPNGVRSAGDRYSGVVHAAQTIARKEGVMTLYRGWLPSFVGTVLYSGLKFGIYETLKDALASYHGLRDARELGLPANLAAGAVAGGRGPDGGLPAGGYPQAPPGGLLPPTPRGIGLWRTGDGVPRHGGLHTVHGEERGLGVAVQGAVVELHQGRAWGGDLVRHV